ncbi:hypothetical protein P152DRAFT_323558 [Eremomyces bilateralis CBS 781.70]|uniref:ER membrane protein complex subunit 4 n=1 Tax=Eremomyces bilateralis CBS 781.70 TaxID=1392243 RepID=A0A6G1G621_9PEZI|nr:uncharacterized protein P152DRAFT_323558 [Eremomyces bilateralis CBS 781.70]KAF1813545.1 hypothetical protein P152DRAFT_323558 [Eremomyces bilateralis CBS 781.70]
MASQGPNPLPPPPPQWVLDMNSTPGSKPKTANIPDPPGFSASGGSKKTASSKQATPRKAPTTEEMDTLKVKKAWEIALGPAKQIPMNAIGMYMSGNSLQIFSIMMVFMLFKTPIQSIMNVQGAFQRFETEGTKSRLLLVKIVYVLMNILLMGLGIYKVNAMGLLPTTRSDWLAWEAQRDYLERAYPALWR